MCYNHKYCPCLKRHLLHLLTRTRSIKIVDSNRQQIPKCTAIATWKIHNPCRSLISNQILYKVIHIQVVHRSTLLCFHFSDSGTYTASHSDEIKQIYQNEMIKFSFPFLFLRINSVQQVYSNLCDRYLCVMLCCVANNFLFWEIGIHVCRGYYLH